MTKLLGVILGVGKGTIVFGRRSGGVDRGIEREKVKLYMSA
jgi:hypothetical protein